MLILLAISLNAPGQQSRQFKPHTVFGLQFKPIIPLSILDTDGKLVTSEEVTLDLEENGGYNFGMVVRHNLTKNWSIEWGINYVSRKYVYNVTGDSINPITEDFNLNNYEIPVQALYYVQLGDRMFMNASLGNSFDFYPTGGLVYFDNDQSIELALVEKNWVQFALVANLGAEYRTPESGTFYLGLSLHRPYSPIADVYVSRLLPNSNTFQRLLSTEVSGSYFTFDIRYFFNNGNPDR